MTYRKYLQNIHKPENIKINLTIGNAYSWLLHQSYGCTKIDCYILQKAGENMKDFFSPQFRQGFLYVSQQRQ